MVRRIVIHIILVICMQLTCAAFNDTAWKPICNDTGWEKVPGMKPEDIVRAETLYAGVDSQGIVVTCFDRCFNTNCTAIIIDFEASACYSVETGSQDFVPQPQVTFYHKICLKVPPTCRSRLWQVERTLGAVLIDSDNKATQQTLTRSQCYQKCIDAGLNCQAAQFRTSRDLAIDDSPGQCVLLSISRSFRPQSYRASMYRDEYLETQCHNLSCTDFCSYAEYRNETLPYSDFKISGLGFKQCEERCSNGNDGFVCRSYTYDSSEPGKSSCLLHSDDTLGAGVSGLVKKSNVVYREREPCLDLKVRCSNTSLTIELRTKDPFYGRLYVDGYSETCSVQGNNHNKTTLVLSLPEKEDLSAGNIACGVTPAYALDNNNRTRTAVWTTVVIQYNPIVQRLGDQSVRVGCTLEDPDVPESTNVVVTAGFDFEDANAGIPPVTGTIFNTTAAPVVTMRILDQNNKEIHVTSLGDKLTLRIDISPPDGPYDIFAGHLVASSASGASSILLLDERGCPSDRSVFPAMTRDPTNNRSLTATFDAFKFPDSPRVRFDVIVKFCLMKCEPVTCRTGVIAYGKRRRSALDLRPLHNISDDSELVISDEKIDELPLQKSILVRDQVITADRFRGNKDTDDVSTAASQSVANLLCMDPALVLGLLVFWLCLQIVLIFGCIFLIRRYRRYARQAEQNRADILARHLYGIHGGNFEIARRVRWADHNGSSIS